MKMKKKPSERRELGRAYDLEMIRDFLDHLKWEIRINLHELDHGDTINPELAEQLAKYMKKRQTGGLLAATVVGGGDDAEWRAKFKEVKRDLRTAQLSALDFLDMTLMPEAFGAAKLGAKIGMQKYETFEQAARACDFRGVLDDDVPSEDDNFGTDDEPPAYDDGYPKDDDD